MEPVANPVDDFLIESDVSDERIAEELTELHLVKFATFILHRGVNDYTNRPIVCNVQQTIQREQIVSAITAERWIHNSEFEDALRSFETMCFMAGGDPDIIREIAIRKLKAERIKEATHWLRRNQKRSSSKHTSQV